MATTIDEDMLSISESLRGEFNTDIDDEDIIYSSVTDFHPLDKYNILVSLSITYLNRYSACGCAFCTFQGILSTSVFKRLKNPDTDIYYLNDAHLTLIDRNTGDEADVNVSEETEKLFEAWKIRDFDSLELDYRVGIL